jgi:hypothetical protein
MKILPPKLKNRIRQTPTCEFNSVD